MFGSLGRIRSPYSVLEFDRRAKLRRWLEGTLLRKERYSSSNCPDRGKLCWVDNDRHK